MLTEKVIEGIRDLLEAAVRNQEAAKAATEHLRETETRLAEQVRKLSESLGSEIDRKAMAIVRMTTSRLDDQLKEVIEAADRARAAYQNAADITPKKLVQRGLAYFAVGCIGMVVGVYISACMILPPPAVLEREREAKQAVQQLRDLGGDAVVTDCLLNAQSTKTRPCVRTDEREFNGAFGLGTATYRLIYPRQ